MPSMPSAPSTTLRPLLAGAARAMITPPVGIRMLGYTVQECVSESIERNLTATALVLTDGLTKTALLACDLLFIQSPHVERICRRIGEQLNIPADHVLINASHTHLGPMMPGWHADDPQQTALQQRYLDFLEDALAGVAAMANRELRPARIGAGKGSTPIGVNRRERLSDGRILIGQNPAGAVDHEVGVIRVDDLAGKPIATLMTAAAHTIVLGPKTSQLSPDYVGPAREIVESATGAPALFFQGAAGNVSPCCGVGAGGAEQYDDLQRLGAMLGGAVLSTWAQIRTHNRQGPRRVVQSVAAISVWNYEPLPSATIKALAVRTQRRTLPMGALPERAAAIETLTHYRARLEELGASEAGAGERHVAERLVHWAELVVRTHDAGVGAVTRELACWALRINDIGIVAVNGEPFAELGLEVKRRSPLAHTWFLGYSNGCLGYFPTPEAFDEGGMEVHESVQNYMLPAPFTRQWGPAVVDACLDLLNQLR